MSSLSPTDHFRAFFLEEEDHVKPVGSVPPVDDHSVPDGERNVVVEGRTDGDGGGKDAAANTTTVEGENSTKNKLDVSSSSAAVPSPPEKKTEEVDAASCSAPTDEDMPLSCTNAVVQVDASAAAAGLQLFGSYIGSSLQTIATSLTNNMNMIRQTNTYPRRSSPLVAHVCEPSKAKKARSAFTTPLLEDKESVKPTIGVVGQPKAAAAQSKSNQKLMEERTQRMAAIAPAQPPNFDKHLEDTIMSFSCFKKFNIAPDSKEYLTLTQLLNPLQLTSAKRIVNPALWQRFTNTKKQMLLSKSEDLELLSKLGLSQKELERQTYLSANFVKSPLLTSEFAKYCPNEVLLFHCTRREANLDKIFSQGLDDRLFSRGTLGNGIYFADDPLKATQYAGGTGTILVFAVLLGDCLSTDRITNKESLVREPEKVSVQKRNASDLFFDSIVGRPLSQNEYVVFNRYQCCPLYEIKYATRERPLVRGPLPISNAGSRSQYQNDIIFLEARRKIPTFAWRGETGSIIPMPNQYFDLQWPYFTASVFKQMSEETWEEEEEPKTKMDDDGHSAAGSSNGAGGSANISDGCTEELNKKHLILVSLGFLDKAKNLKALQKCKEDLDLAATLLLEQSENDEDDNDNNGGSQPQPIPNGTAPGNFSGSTTKKLQLMVSKETQVNFDILSSPPALVKEECSICCNELLEFFSAPHLWEQLNCGHKMCQNCYGKILTSRTTMNKARCTSVRCPFCKKISGTLVGDCPDGSMTVTTMLQSCDGYPNYPSIKIDYRVSSGRHYLNRTAYLPASQGGYEVLELLRTAWQRRLTFTIGTSNTTGAQNTLVWNIHHKTSISGGVTCYGYPDPSYLVRVREELKTFGIE